MTRPKSRAFRPRIEPLESLQLPTAGPVGAVATALAHGVNLRSTPIATDAKIYVAASTPSSGRRAGSVDILSADGATRTVTGSVSLAYHTRLLPSYLSLFSPYETFTVRVYFSTSLDNPNPGDVKVSFNKNVFAFGGNVRTKVAQGVVAFIRHDHDRIAAAIGG